MTAELPTGDTVKLPAAGCKVCGSPVVEIDDIIATAERLIGTPYFWGGRTSKGIDCSGLVQMSYAAAGLHLPRDAYQQFYLGQLTATRWHTAGMRRGDTLYFLGADGKIRHTAIYLGDDRYLQAVDARRADQQLQSEAFRLRRGPAQGVRVCQAAAGLRWHREGDRHILLRRLRK